MDKQRLTTLINQPEKIKETDFKDLTNLKNEYPYFQALSPLITLGSKKYSPQHEKKHLQTAAIYALDRKQLKEILTKDYDFSTAEKTEEKPKQKKESIAEKNRVVGNAPQEQAKTEKKEVPNRFSKIEITPPSDSSHLPDSFFEELFREMEDLKAEKENYQKSLEKFEAKQSAPKTKATKKTTAKAGTKKATTTKTSTAKKSTAKAKTSSAKKTSTAKKDSTAKKTTTSKSTAKKASSAKSKESNSKSSTSNKTKKTAKSTNTKPKSDEHDIIKELSSRKELKINDAHKKEQLNIINNFIEKEPVLSKRINTDNQSNKQEAEDLSASSTNLSDDVVSETLAKLMIKQGRKQKAIDIYKKLIWKFPQKKTYFVEIIEELKKES